MDGARRGIFCESASPPVRPSTLSSRSFLSAAAGTVDKAAAVTAAAGVEGDRHRDFAG